MYDFSDIAAVPPFPENEPGFVEQLRRYALNRPHWTGDEVPEELVYLGSGWELVPLFPDPEELLTSAYQALERFKGYFSSSASPKLQIFTRCDAALEMEEYIISVRKDGITLASADTEGMRRAVYALIDLMRSGDVPGLPETTIRRKPWLKNRISRCFFGPIKRPPFFRDELLDDIDYYPDAYLDRLASEGVNGIWLTVVWRELAETGFFPTDPQRSRRIAKLKRTVEKCRKYGIKVWIFCIEPASWNTGNVPPEKDMQSDLQAWDYRAFCIACENSKRYIRECSGSIFRDVPHLGGMMLISLGERPTSCLSYIGSDPAAQNACAGRCGLSNSQILQQILCSIKDGIRDAGSEAEVLSWLYNPSPEQIPDWYFELPEELSEDQILAFNFESGCTGVQTGKIHAGGDYWLSAAGPSDRFGRFAAGCRNNCELAAKLQVGCSHELATVPFMPVPGQLYRKYRAMKTLGVKHVIQCWYFGNYPGIMNRAAGSLAFEDFSQDEKSFLTALAAPDWGNAQAEKIGSLWQKFGEAYRHYPLNIQYQYYGPMHDGVVWPLHVKAVKRSMTRSWKPDNFPCGDVIGESLINHSLSDAVILSRLLAKEWKSALDTLPELRQKYADDPDRQRDCDLYEALAVLFESGADIMEFYLLRQKLHRGKISVIPQMIALAENGKTLSRRMIALCQSDCRLGYHPEAEIYKFHPAKLAWRIGELDKTISSLQMLQHLSGEEAAVQTAWQGSTMHPGTRYQAETFTWQVRIDGSDLVFELDFDDLADKPVLEFRFLMLMDKSLVKFPVIIQTGVTEEYLGCCNAAEGAQIIHLNGNKTQVRIPWSRFEYASEIFAGVHRLWYDENSQVHNDNFPPGKFDPDFRLNLMGHTPEQHGLLILE